MSDNERWNFSPGDNFHDGGEKNVVFITHNYRDVSIVNQGDNVQISKTINDSMEILLLKYFRNLSDDAEKLKIVTLVQKMNK